MSADLRTMTKTLQSLVGTEMDGVFGPVTAAATVAALMNSRTPPKHAEDFVFDARTEGNLATLTRGAQHRFRPFVAQAQAVAAAMGCDYRMISGTRSYAEQAVLRKRWQAGTGGKAAAAGYSNHNFGIAGDFGVFLGSRYMDGSKVRSERELALAVHKAVATKAAGHKLVWGGTWKGKSNDPPHFEVWTGLTMKQKRDRVKAGREVV